MDSISAGAGHCVRGRLVVACLPAPPERTGAGIFAVGNMDLLSHARTERSGRARGVSLETISMGLEPTAQSRKNRARGFATLTVLVWLPLLLALATAVSLVASALLDRTQAQSSCYRVVLRLQDDLRAKLRELLALNPKAARLRQARTLAERHLREALATGNLALIAAASAERAAVLSAQIALRGRQQLLLVEARRLRLAARQELMKGLPRISARLHPKSHRTSDGLAVYASPPMDLTPAWKLRPLFEAEQTERMDYSVTLFQGVPSWIGLSDFKKHIVQKAQCGATLRRRGRLFELATAADRL